LSARERPDAARLAEEMVDHLLVELVVGQRLLALLQHERGRRHEGQQGAGARADRAVALRDRLREVDLDAVAHRAAMTSAAVAVRHADLLWRGSPIRAFSPGAPVCPAPAASVRSGARRVAKL